MNQGEPPPDFPTAAHRHYQDARLLRKEQRLANADHFAGMAAECGLKAILVGHLGGYVTTKNRPNHPEYPSSKSGPSYGHLPTLWEEISLVAGGRNANAFHQALAQGNPFRRWKVAERYASGKHIDASRVDEHLDATEQILSFYQQAQIDGILP